MLATTAILAFLALPGVADSTPVRMHRVVAITCRPVNTVINAAAGHIGPALTGVKIKGSGTSQGDLPGAVSIEILKPFIGKDLDVAFRIRLVEGELIARGSATTQRDSAVAGSPATHTIHSAAKVMTGSGAFAQSSGTISGVGHVDTHTRLMTLAITGVVCADWSALAGQS